MTTITGTNKAPVFSFVHGDLIFSDDFDRPDGDPGAPWTIVKSGAEIEDGRLRVEGEGGFFRPALTTAFDNEGSLRDYLVEVVIDPDEERSRVHSAIMVRTQGVDTSTATLVRGTGYWVEFNNYKATTVVSLLRSTDGETTTLKNVLLPVLSSPFAAAISVKGNALDIAIDGDLVLSYVDIPEVALEYGGIALFSDVVTTNWFDDVAIYAEPNLTLEFSVDENAAAGTSVAALSATDPDGDAVVYALVWGGDDVDGDGIAPFTIDSSSGEITVADGDDLDSESTDAIRLEVTATDPEGLAATATATITLNDVPEPGNDRPDLTSAKFEIPQGAPNGTFVGRLQATDSDAGDTLTYTITDIDKDPDRDGVAAFGIDPTTGEIIVTDGRDLLDRVEFTLHVSVVDSGGLADEAEVVVLLDFRRRIWTYDRDDFVQGYSGDDLILAGGGNDTLQGMNGDDVLLGESGIDVVLEIADADFVLADNRLSGRGNDILDSIERAVLTGGASNNRLDASAFTRGAVELDGRGGADRLIAPAAGDGGHGWRTGSNHLAGGAGNDVFVGGAGRDVIVETADVDFSVGDGTLDGVGLDRFSGIEGLRLTGGAGDNRIDVSGFRGERTFLEGAGGDDVLVGGPALDAAIVRGDGDFVLTGDSLLGEGLDALVGIDAVRLIGGVGRNTFDVSAATARMIIMVGHGGADTFIGGDRAVDWVCEAGDVDFTLTADSLTGRGADTLIGIDFVRLIGGASANVFDVSGFNGIRTYIHPEGGDDTVIGRGDGIDRIVAGSEAHLTLFDDRLLGDGVTTLVNVEEAELFALGGDAVLDASAFTRGPVRLVGGQGDDVLRGGAADDSLTGGFGDDLLFGGAGSDWVVASADVDMTLTDDALIGVGRDSLDSIERARLGGGGGDNVLDASRFTGVFVILDGGFGDDLLIGRAGRVDAVQAKGDVDFTLTDEKLTGTGENLLVDIERARLFGGAGSNVFDASAFTLGSVQISAGGGDDVLIGGHAADRLNGGAGADVYWLLASDGAADWIAFVPGEDTLRLDASAFAGLPVGVLSGSRFVVGDSALPVGEAALHYDPATGALRFDADGAGGLDATLIATLAEAPDLSSSDIFVDDFAL